MQNNQIAIPAEAFQKIEQKENKTVLVKEQSICQSIWKELKKNKLACVCLILLFVVMIASILAPLSKYDPYAIDVTQKLQGISSAHILGTDDYGRDYFTRALYGGRVSLTVGFLAMAVGVVLGTGIGVAAGYLGGKVDVLLMRFTDIFLAIPSMLLMIVINTILSPGLTTLIMVLSLFSWPSVARITRAETMSLKERDFVKASINLGAGGVRVILTHIIPNIMGSVIVSASLGVANAILTESSLSFLGLGIQMPLASWGSMLKDAQAHVLDMPFMAVVPGLLILLTVLTFNLLGDVLRSAFEPKNVY